MALLRAFTENAEGKKFELVNVHFPSWGEQGNTLSFVSVLILCKQVSFYSLLSATFFTFLLVIALFKMSLGNSAEVLFSVPKRKNAAMCLMEKVCALDKLYSGMSFSSVGHEFKVNKLTMYIA